MIYTRTIENVQLGILINSSSKDYDDVTL